MKQLSPPKWADKFLRWYCSPDLLEEIEGDIYEIFEREAAADAQKARRRFIWNVLRFFRWANIKRTNSNYKTNQMGLIKNYFTVGFRNLSKNWGISLINILGLSVAIGMGIAIFIFVDMQTHMDDFHSNRRNIYQLINHVKTENSTAMWADAPLLIGPDLVDKHAGVDNVVRVEFQYGNMRFGDNVFSELVSFVDPALLKVFDFPIKYGDINALENKSYVVIDKNTAEKYFGRENAMGKDVSIKYSNGMIQNYTVGAVMDKTPDKASFSFEIMVPMDNFFDLQLEDHYDWAYSTDAIFIEMKEGRQPQELEETFSGFVALQNQTSSKWPIEKFEMVPLEQLALRSFEIDGSISGSGHPAGRIGLSVVAAMLVLLACFNYMNISVTAATRRLKEIAMRKVIGGNRRQIIYQFILENMILCTFALGLGTVMSYYFFLPGLNTMIPITIPFEFSSLPMLIAFFGGLLLFIGMVSGAYPAFYVSKFQPTSIFRGNEKLGSKNVFSKILLGFQFFFAISTIIACFVFTDNAIYQAEKDWGYNPKGIISMPLVEASDFQALRDAANRNTAVLSYAGSNYHVARANKLTKADVLDKEVKTYAFHVGENYMETMGFRLKEGRFFGDSKAADQSGSIIVTEMFVEKAGWGDAIGQQVTYDSTRYTVVGVVEDFMCNAFYDEMLPTVFTAAPEEGFNYFVVKTAAGNEKELDEYFASAWTGIAPNDPYNSKYQVDVFDYFFKENQGNIVVISFISGLAIVLACLGLFGLLGFSIQSRKKEFGIRKVLGADATQIIRIASKQYFWTILIAFLLGAPAGAFLITQMINAIYPDPKETTVLPFILAMGIVLVTTAVTVASQVAKATSVNPVDTLRSE
ncbi:ABC transporter permease [Imperialibacter roseus]|uniref:ABC transporter permease n=1 Tax=Imperialibacter roseus TaxID=1324217 RepID=A0ABZ0IKR6_9BACT|nr:ABC transporter permease [Imperialibacter roseus]WOK05109.1 ABC transporter permease [Imperialibacter roseus]